MTIKVKDLMHKALNNLWSFSKIMILILFSIKIFGPINTLPAVCVAVAWLMFPLSNLQIKSSAMIFNIFALFLVGAVGGELVYVNPYIAAIGYFIVTVVILACSIAPFMYQPSIPFLLNFVFCQSQPVSGHQFLLRILCLLSGSIFVTILTMWSWRRRGYSNKGRNLKHQIIAAKPYSRYILKMAVGLSIAMTLAHVFHFVKPLWISIVVMSLIEIDSKQIYEKIHDRFIGTIIGIIIFVVVIKLLLPSGWDSAFILLMGYVSFFFTHYRIKTIVNAVSALTAALILLRTPLAIFNRLICLIIGIVLVLLIEWIIPQYESK